MSYGPSTKTVQNVYDYVKRVFGDEAGVQLSDNDIVRWINEAQREIAHETACLQATATTSIVAGQADYTVGAITPVIYEISSVLIDGKRVVNMSVSQAEESISLADPEESETGAPQFWYEWANTLTFWPVPNAAGTLTIRYVAEPTDITATGTDVLSLPDEYFQDIITFVLKQAYEMDENPEMMQLKAAEYESSLAERGERSSNAQNMTYPTMIVYELQ